MACHKCWNLVKLLIGRDLFGQGQEMVCGFFVESVENVVDLFHTAPQYSTIFHSSLKWLVTVKKAPIGTRVIRIEPCAI